MTQKFIALLVTALLNGMYLTNLDLLPTSDSDIFIYGKVYTEDNEVYEGQIRWGKEEAFWFDHFNSSKPENENLEYLSKKERDNLDGERSEIRTFFNFDISWGNGWNNDHTHQFACEFGNIKSLDMGRKGRVSIELKNGEILRVKGGSNDIGATVQVSDKELGHIKLDWDRIERVEFMQSGTSYESHYGAPLYGTVETEYGETFTGYVQWDHDERLANDELNGKNRDGEMDLEFGNIEKIKSTRRGALVTMRSGREFDLWGTNDVDDDNRGIIVNIPGMGRVDIPWDEFDQVTFSDPKIGVVNYDDFDGFHEINGSIVTDKGAKYSGRIVYDLDESYQFEILNGSNRDIEYFIPFQYIKEIIPSSRNKTTIILKSGKKIELEDSVDVSEDHDGLLVFDDKRDPEYIEWRHVESIKF